MTGNLSGLDSNALLRQAAPLVQFLNWTPEPAILSAGDETRAILAVNEAACEFYGYSVAEFEQLSLDDIVLQPPPGLRVGVEALESTQRKRDGSLVRVLVHAMLLAGDPPLQLAVVRERNTQYGSEVVNAASDKLFRSLIQASTYPNWIFDQETYRFLAVNKAAIDVYGYSEEEFLSMTVLDIRPPEDVPLLRASLATQWVGTRYFGPWRHRKRDGTIIRIEAWADNIRYEDRVAQFVRVRDVTDRLRVSEMLAYNESYYRALLDHALDVITIVDGNGIVKYESPSLYRVLGYRPEEIVGQPALDLAHPDDVDKLRAGFHTTITEGTLQKAEVRLRHKDGTYRVLELIGHERLEHPLIAGVVVNSRDITDRRAAEAALRMSEKRLALAQKAGRVGTWEYDYRSRKLILSESMASLCGREPAELDTLRKWLRNVPVEDRHKILAGMSGLDDPSKAIDTEFRMIRPDGSIRWLAAKGEAVCGGDGQPFCLMGAAFDVTDRKVAREQAERARDAALEAARIKSQFLATVSHEIRTPMNAILGMNGLLLDSELSPLQRSDAETIRDSALYLLDLVNDVLDFSRLEAGRFEGNPAPANIRQCLRGILDMVAVQAKEKGLRVELECSDEVPPVLVLDAGRLRQIVLNFAGNAVKFTDWGLVRIHAGISRTPERQMLRVEVTDTGPGISLGLQTKLFQKFVQGDGSDTRRHSGTGLGLAISKGLAEAMGGSVGFRSTHGAGATFWVELPADTADAGAGHHAPSAGPPDFSGLDFRVLVVDDNLVNQSLAARLLVGRGIRADVAFNGSEALEACRRCDYDLILMDCQMPQMDGYEATRHLRKRGGRGAVVPVVAMTASSGIEEKRRCSASGMNDFLAKPFRPDDLDSILRAWLPARAATVSPASIGDRPAQCPASSGTAVPGNSSLQDSGPENTLGAGNPAGHTR